MAALEDQQCAGALMWACVTFVYLVPATILTTRLLTSRNSEQEDVLVQPELHGMTSSQRDQQCVEVV
jgi:hypothetical protein